MFAGESEACLLAMIEAYAVPTISRVARGAIRCEATLVHVIGGVTTGAAEFRILVGCRGMTSLAGDHRVKAAQRKAREPVIERHIGSPGGGRMALATLRSELRLVHILRLMTTEAGGFDSHQHRVAMATGAFRCGVCSFEWKFALCIVIEFCGLERLLGVARGAFGAEPRLMHILNRVAAVAILCHIFVDFAEMT